MTDDLRVKDFWQLSPDEQVKAMKAVKPVSVEMREYLVRGVLTVKEWEGGEPYTLKTIEVVTALSPHQAINIAWELAGDEADNEECEDYSWDVTNINILSDVEIEYRHLLFKREI